MNALYAICGLGVLSLLAEILNLRKYLVAILALGVAVSAALLIPDWGLSRRFFSNMLVFDNMAIAFSMLICIVGVCWFWMARDYLYKETQVTDQAALILFSTAGAIVMTSFNNLSMLFLGLEILSITLYALAGSRKQSLFSNEASFKYLLLGSFATGFLLMGIALIYGATGTFQLDRIAAIVGQNSASLPAFFYAGILLVLVGASFKVSAVPFHSWAPDVYDGAPTPVTAFMATIAKIAAFGSFLRLFYYSFSEIGTTWQPAVQIMTALTLLLPNITAVYQTSVKRMLAYSGVGHAGFVLLAILSGTGDAPGIVFYYFCAYSAASLTAFTILDQMERSEGKRIDISYFNGLFKTNPIAAVVMTVALLSMAGIPPLAGFFGKYLVFVLALGQGHLWLVLIAILASLIGVYYYFRLMVAMYISEPQPAQQTFRFSGNIKLLLVFLLVLTLAAGIFPDLLRFF